MKLKNLPYTIKKGRINTAFVFTWKSSKKRIFERFGLMIMYPKSQMLIFHDHLRFTRPIPRGCGPGDWSLFGKAPLLRLSLQNHCRTQESYKLHKNKRWWLSHPSEKTNRQLVDLPQFFWRFDKFKKDWNHMKPSPSDLVELLNSDLVPDGSVLYWIWILQRSSRYSFQPSN